MASWQVEQFLKFTQAQKIEPFYVFLGDETYLVEQSLKCLKKTLFPDGGEDFNFDSFDGSDCDMNDVSQAVETLPMMSSKRLVLLKRGHELNSSDLETLSNILSVPIDTTCFVVLFDKMDSRKKISKDILKKAAVVDFSPPPEKSIPMWIQKITTENGKKISLKDAHLLKNTVGVHLMDLANEIQKLSSFVGDSDTITQEDIEKIVSKTKLDSIFELTKCIGERKLEKSLQIQKYLLDQGESEVGILAMITRHFRLLLLSKEALGKKLNPAQVSSYIGVPPFFVQSYIDQSKLFTFEDLKTIYQRLLKTDRLLKSSPIKGQIYLNHLILETLTV